MAARLPARLPIRRIMAAAAVAALALTGVALPGGTAAAVSPDVVISEVYGGGGNSGARWRNDFVELYNRGAASVDLSGWSVQYAAAAGTAWQVTPLAGTLAPGRHYLVAEAAGAGGTDALPAPDATGTIAMGAGGGKVALATTAAALGCGADCDRDPGVRDFAGYGGAADFEGGGPAAGPSNTASVSRTAAGTDTDDNAADFTAGPPSPTNASGATGPGGPGDPGDPGDPGEPPAPTATIAQIQGAAHRSPRAGETVTAVGVVTAAGGGGFWMQDGRPDPDPATSEGVFVFTDAAPPARPGDLVNVTGRVAEFRPGGNDSTNLTTTEIVAAPAAVRVLSGGNPLPAATVVGAGGRVPPGRTIDDDATGDVETSGTFDPDQDGIDFYESLEGMRVQVPDPVAVGPRNSFGEIPVLADRGRGASVRTARGGIVVRPGDFNPERIILDDAALAGSTPAGVNVGDTFSGPAGGVLDYGFGNYKLLLTSALTRVAGPITRERTAAASPGEVSVATFNVENLSAVSPQAKFDALGATIVGNLAAPHIIAVEEIQDDDGPADTGTVTAGRTWTRLIDAIAAAGGPRYDYRQIDPVDKADGGEPGGNIRVGFLFRTDTGLRFAGGTPGDATTPVEVAGTGPWGPPRLTRNPGRIDPANPAFANSRKPLAAEFRYRGAPLFVVANHWNSKSGDDPLFGRVQPPVRDSETQRRGQAEAVAGIVRRLLSVDPTAAVVVAGDLNDFEFSTAVRTLSRSAWLLDLPATLPLPERYTYVFDGNSQVLDHILISPALALLPFRYDVVHVNAEFADQVSDHDPQVVRVRPLPRLW
jgi:predicted extracellular nuclease